MSRPPSTSACARLSLPRSPFDLTGQVAVVTAGCKGLGLDVARTLAALGARVIGTSRSADTVAACNATWAAEMPGLEARQLDFQSQSCDRLFAEIAAAHGGLHILVNCAGGRFPATTPEETTAADFLAEIEASVVTAFTCSQRLVAARESTKVRAIVNVGSVYGELAVDHRIYLDPAKQTPIAYAAAKAALVQMTRYLAAYWAPLGIRMNCVSPGGIKRAQAADFLARYGARVPMGRMGEASEIAGVVAFLASPASAYVTGENIMADGGLHVW